MIDLAKARIDRDVDRVNAAVDAAKSALDFLGTLVIGMLSSEVPRQLELIDFSEAAKRLNTSERQVERLVANGAIPAVWIPSGRGDKPLGKIDAADLERCAEQWKR